jgi:hypothetical protein
VASMKSGATKVVQCVTGLRGAESCLWRGAATGRALAALSGDQLSNCSLLAKKRQLAGS